MEAHFVHAAEGGGLAVLGVFIVPGKHNAVFNKIVQRCQPNRVQPLPPMPP